MMLLMQTLQALPRHMGIYLRGAQIAVPQQQLHHAQIGPVIDQVRRKSVSQNMRRDRLGDTRDCSMLLDSMPERLPGHRRAPPAGEKRFAGLVAEQLRPDLA
jgi:hypothetical protein